MQILNRLREGIRVVEDIFRYIYNDKQTVLKLKELDTYQD